MKKTLLILGLCLAFLCTGLCLVLPGNYSPAAQAAPADDPWAHIPTNEIPTTGTRGSATYPIQLTQANISNTNLLPTTTTYNATSNPYYRGGVHFILTEDITLPTSNWTPRILPPFSVFDGNNYTISGLSIGYSSAVSSSQQGFFSNVMGTVKNITFENAYVRSSSGYIGIVAGKVWSSPPSSITMLDGTSVSIPAQDRNATLYRVFVSGSVQGSSDVGGVIGNSDSECHITIDSCLNKASVTGSSSYHIGGIIGRTSNTNTNLYITRCGNEGTINASSVYDIANGIGGIAGCICAGGPTTVEYSYNRGAVNKGHAGIVGMLRISSGKAAVMNCFNDALITGQSSSTKMGAIIVRESTSGTLWAQNNWSINNWKKPGATAAVGSGHLLTNPDGTECKADSIFGNGKFINTGSTLPSDIGYNLSSDYEGDYGLEAFVELLNTGTENPAYILVDGEIQLISVTRTRLITFNTNGAPVASFQRHWDPAALVFDKFPDTIGTGGIGEKPYHDFAGWSTSGRAGRFFANDDFLFTPSDNANIVFDANWVEKQLTVSFHESPAAQLLDTSATPTSVTSFVIGQEKLELYASNWIPTQGRSVWMIKKAGAPSGDESSWVPLSNQNNFKFNEKITNDADGVAFLDKYTDGTQITIKLVIVAGSTTTIEISSDNTDGGTFGYSLTGSESVTQVNMSFQYFSLPSAAAQIEKLYVTASENYVIDSIEIWYTASDITPSVHHCPDPDKKVFTLTVSGVFETGARIKINLEKIIYELDVRASLNSKFDQSILPESFIDNNFQKEIAVNDDVNIPISAVLQGIDGQNAFEFTGWKIFDVTAGDNGEYVPLFSTNTVKEGYATFTLEGTIDSNWLRSYLEDYSGAQKISIIAEYVPLYKVRVGDGSDSHWGDNFDADAVACYVINGITEEKTKAELDTSYLFPEGSLINIEVYTSFFIDDRDPSFFYQLASFKESDSDEYYEYDVNGNQITAFIEIFGNHTINPVFEARPFDVTYKAVALAKNGANDLPNVSGFSLTKEGSNNQVLKLGDVLTNVTKPSLQEYQFEGFTLINQTDGASFDLSAAISGGGVEINAEFLFNYISRATDKITIQANYVKLFGLNIAMLYSEDAGTMKVYTNEVKPENLLDGNANFLSNLSNGAELIIVAVPNYGYIFKGFDTESEVPPSSNQLAVTIGTGRRSVVAYFRPDRIDLNEKLIVKGSGKSSSTRLWSGTVDENSYRAGDNKNDLRVGDQIEIIATPGFFGSKVTKWTLNGYDVNELGNVERSGNLITVTLTSDWCFNEGEKFDSRVVFGLTDEFIMFVIVPLVLAVLLGAAFLLYFLNLQKKKRVIKAVLLADKRARAGFTQHNLVSDVREGKAVGGVSDATIQAVMKAKHGGKNVGSISDAAIQATLNAEKEKDQTNKMETKPEETKSENNAEENKAENTTENMPGNSGTAKDTDNTPNV